ncbi:MAG: leucine-rich repeat domain-containing protein [Ruminococcus sp.]|nr:leucine-rich repeat domain-containing protein [Ruminococcus sp.]
MGFEIENGVLERYTEEQGITKVAIPDGVTSIGDRAFYECDILKEIKIPDSVTNIGNEAFYWCEQLIRINIPDSVTSIGDGAFYWCESLEEVNIPDSVTSIGNGAFYWCICLTEVTFKNITVPFRGIHEDRTRDLKGVINMIENKDFSAKIPAKSKYAAACGVFNQNPDDEEVFAYIKRNFTKVFKFAIDSDNMQFAIKVAEQGKLLTKRNIDSLIEYSVAKKKSEISGILTKYKNENLF